MDTTTIKQRAMDFVKASCLSAIPKNVKNPTLRVIAADSHSHAALSLLTDQRDLESVKVAGINEEFLVVLKDRKELIAIPRETIRQQAELAEVEAGDTATIVFHKTRRFDGKRLSGEDDSAIHDGDGFVRRRYQIGGSQKFPVTWEKDEERGRYARDDYEGNAEPKTAIKNPYLIDMIEQIERMQANNGRKLISMMIDCCKGELTYVDPPEDQSCDPDPEKWPAFSMRAKNMGTAFNFTQRFDRASDVYQIVVERDGESPEVTSDVYFDELPDIYLRLFDNDEHTKCDLTVIAKAKKTRMAA